MAAGDLVVATWQVEIRATLFGETTVYGIDRRAGAIRGLVADPVELAQTEYAHAAGAFVGQSRKPSRVASFAWEICGSSAANAESSYETLKTAWATSNTDLPLHFRLAGASVRYVNGRPLGVQGEDLSQADFGIIACRTEFRITDPTIYTA